VVSVCRDAGGIRSLATIDRCWSAACAAFWNPTPYVAEILTGWAVFELQKTPEEVLEALAEELCGNEQLRAFVAGLVAD
jgi:hypothetical protein